MSFLVSFLVSDAKNWVAQLSFDVLIDSPSGSWRQNWLGRNSPKIHWQNTAEFLITQFITLVHRSSHEMACVWEILGIPGKTALAKKKDIA